MAYGGSQDENVKYVFRYAPVLLSYDEQQIDE